MYPLLRRLSGLAALAILAMGIPFAACRFNPKAPGVAHRGVVLWAWERPERLGFIDPKTTAVALLAATVRIERDTAVFHLRRQPITLPDAAPRLAVVRLEAARGAPGLDGRQIAEMAGRLARFPKSWRALGLQIDFDATVSQRPFYRELLRAVRQRLPQGASLSITALASWCLGDPWIADLPVDEAVPMIFRMGSEADPIRRRLAAGGDFTLPLCRTSVGFATDEPVPRSFPDRAVYLFPPHPWTRHALASALEEIDR